MNVSHLLDPKKLAKLEDTWTTKKSKTTLDGRDTTSIFFKLRPLHIQTNHWDLGHT